MSELLPYQILHYHDLPNEVWLPLEGLDGYFFISNLGRVKSIDRYLTHKQGKTAFYKGRIYKPQIITYKNATVNDVAVELKTGFYYLGNSYTIRNARKVYAYFVAPISADKAHYYIGFKDGNNLNAAASNLVLISPHEKACKMYYNNRCKPIYTFQTPLTIINNARARYKPVTQFAKNGLPIAQYKSIQEAAKITGIADSNIVAALKQSSIVSSGGFLWQYGLIHTTINTDYVAAFKTRKRKKSNYKFS